MLFQSTAARTPSASRRRPPAGRVQRRVDEPVRNSTVRPRWAATPFPVTKTAVTAGDPAHDVSTRVGDDRGGSVGSGVSDVSTEDMRQGFVHYRALFAELLEPDGTEHRATG